MPEQVPLRDYIESKFDAQEKAVQAALAAAEKAVAKAELASERRFASVNEFRQALSDQTSTFIARAEYTAAHHSVEQKIQDLTDRMNIMSGRSGGMDKSWGIIVVIVGLALSAVGLMLAFR